MKLSNLMVASAEESNEHPSTNIAAFIKVTTTEIQTVHHVKHDKFAFAKQEQLLMPLSVREINGESNNFPAWLSAVTKKDVTTFVHQKKNSGSNKPFDRLRSRHSTPRPSRNSYGMFSENDLCSEKPRMAKSNEHCCHE